MCPDYACKMLESGSLECQNVAKKLLLKKISKAAAEFLDILII